MNTYTNRFFVGVKGGITHKSTIKVSSTTNRTVHHKQGGNANQMYTSLISSATNPSALQCPSAGTERHRQNREEENT